MGIKIFDYHLFSDFIGIIFHFLCTIQIQIKRTNYKRYICTAQHCKCNKKEWPENYVNFQGRHTALSYAKDVKFAALQHRLNQK